ncbi:MAG: hypothetical protein ACPIOQ_33100 [Promethearchaeia archaeon]
MVDTRRETQALSAGDVVLSVPMDLCIIRQLDSSDATVGTAAPCDLCDAPPSSVKEPYHKSGSPKVKVSEGERRSILWVSEMFLTAELLGAIFGEEEVRKEFESD